jgi:hypothetical protein
VKYGQPAKEKFVRGVSQIGQSLGNHVTDRRQVVNPIEPVRGGVLPGVGTVKLGNETAAELKGSACGPGKGRTIYRSGTQSAPTTRAIPEGRPILSEFGPDVPGRK